MHHFISIIGAGLLFLGVYLSISFGEPHFFTPFSLGLGIIIYQIYNTISRDKVFHNWKIKEYLFFGISLTVVSVIIDKIGMALGYWEYQYVTLIDEVIKYLFEWTIPLVVSMLFFLMGVILLQRKVSYNLAFILSLFTFVIAQGLFIEYINHFSDSWKILSMPITSYAVGGYFLIFQTIGYWLMALIPFAVYKVTESRVRVTATSKSALF